MKIFKIIIVFIFFLVNKSYSQNEDYNNLITIKKSLLNKLLLEDSNSYIFDQSKSTSNILTGSFSDYNISFQRKLNSRLFLGLDFYSFTASNEINPVDLSLSNFNLERELFYSNTDVKLFRISGFYSILNKNNFIIKGGFYIPFFEIKNQDLIAVYVNKINKSEMVCKSTSYEKDKFYFGLVRPELSFDFLYNYKNIETGLSTSWNSNISANEPIIRSSVVLNIRL